MALQDFFSGLSDALLGTPRETFDPYAQDRMLRMDELRRARADYDKMYASPGGAFPEPYRNMLYKQSEEAARSARPGAGGSGWLEDTVTRGRNQINLDLAMKELDFLNKQRDYIGRLAGTGMPTQDIPRQAGMLEGFAGKGFESLGDWMFGGKKKKAPPKDGGMGVTPGFPPMGPSVRTPPFNPNAEGQTSYGQR